MDVIEELAAGILRTSKLTIQGEPGGTQQLPMHDTRTYCGKPDKPGMQASLSSY